MLAILDNFQYVYDEIFIHMRMGFKHHINVHFFGGDEFSNSHIKFLYFLQFMITLTDHASLVTRKLVKGVAIAFPN